VRLLDISVADRPKRLGIGSIASDWAVLLSSLMATSHTPLRLIQSYVEYVPLADVLRVPGNLRGIYVLYLRKKPRGNQKRDHYNVVYVGMARQGGIRRRLRSHRKRKRAKWTHFSIFAVWPNISDGEIAELEGLFRHLFRYDAIASSLNKQRGYKALRKQPRIALRPLHHA
jgi:hypothetical protein